MSTILPASKSLREESSFRDARSGFVFRRDNTLYRQINHPTQPAYDHLMASGLYKLLVDKDLLIPHQEVDIPPADPATAWKIIAPEQIAFIAHPYEWTFGQLKDAALATLQIQTLALEHGMILKDASAYNIQFHHARPTLIDTLSLELYQDRQTWPAYRQFCQHFMAPLALMARRDLRLGQLSRLHIDGVPLDLASQLLPRRTRLSLGLQAHIHLHAAAQKRYADRGTQAKRASMSKFSLQSLMTHLSKTVQRLKLADRSSTWSDYYDQTNYAPADLDHKQQLVEQFLDEVHPQTVWDLGSNTGRFSFAAASHASQVIGFEADPIAAEIAYRRCRELKTTNVLPLVQDLTNPSPALGFDHRERPSLEARGPADCAMMLALIHHLAIANNVPLPRLAQWAARLCRWLIIEFVPKSDSQVQRLLAGREDIFPDYAQDPFERDFTQHFDIRHRAPIGQTPRTLYLMQRRQQ